MFKPYRNTKNDMTFERAERMEARTIKSTQEFFENAMHALYEAGKEDEAFYFEMVVDHLKDGGTLDPNKVSRILGL